MITPPKGYIKSEIISLLADFVGAFVKSIYIV